MRMRGAHTLSWAHTHVHTSHGSKEQDSGHWDAGQMLAGHVAYPRRDAGP